MHQPAPRGPATHMVSMSSGKGELSSSGALTAASMGIAIICASGVRLTSWCHTCAAQQVGAEIKAVRWGQGAAGGRHPGALALASGAAAASRGRSPAPASCPAPQQLRTIADGVALLSAAGARPAAAAPKAARMSSGRVGVEEAPGPMPMVGVSMSDSSRSGLGVAAGLPPASAWRCAVAGVAKVGVGAAAGVRAAAGGPARRPLAGVGMPLRCALAGACGAGREAGVSAAGDSPQKAVSQSVRRAGRRARTCGVAPGALASLAALRGGWAASFLRVDSALGLAWRAAGPAGVAASAAAAPKRFAACLPPEP
jgi:hypothetical protein